MAGTFCGQADPPVNAAGDRQMRTLVESLRTEPIAAIFTSDLQRALTAAQGLAEVFAAPWKVPCIPRRDLREIGFGQWEGLTWEQIETLDAAFARQWLDEFPHLTPPQGESFAKFEARVMAEVFYLVDQGKHGLTAVVTHAGVMRVVLQNLCGLDVKAASTLTKQYCCTFRYAPHARTEQRLQERHV
jgi:alpha-ribazole phosphatase/probable phosphoglycerate mutase